MNSVFPHEEEVIGISQMHTNLKINKQSLKKKGSRGV